MISDYRKKRCARCKRLLWLCKFYKTTRGIGGHTSYCKKCSKECASRWWRERQAKVKKEPTRESAMWRAIDIANKAVRDGILIKKFICEECGEIDEHLHKHHEDYSKPLEVNWLCIRCHTRLHGSFVKRVKLTTAEDFSRAMKLRLES